MDFRQLKAIEKANKEKLIKHWGNIPEISGIYILTRYENGFKYAYVGQAKKLLSRLEQHYRLYKQHIDRSLKAHKLYSEENKSGWSVLCFYCEESKLNDMETRYIKEYHDNSYQLLNKTSGSQGEGKTKIAEYKPAKNYYDGLEQGKRKLQKELLHIADKYLDINLKNPESKLAKKMLEKFNKLLKE